MSHLHGLDKDIHERIQDKYDPILEQKALDWIGVVSKTKAPKVLGNDGASLYKYLKSGVILCKMINNISPNIISKHKITDSPKNMLEERQNIEEYLIACKKLGILSQDMFILSDLHSAKSISAVLQNIYAVGRQAQVIPGFKAPILGVRYNISIEEQQRRIKIKEEEKKQKEERQKLLGENQRKRRNQLENEKREEIIKDMEVNDMRKLHRQLTKGKLSQSQFHKLAKESDKKFNELRTSDVDLVSNSDIKYGMDIDIHNKRKNAYSFKNEEEVMNWIEIVTGENIDDFYSDLKSGIILCKLINCIYPNIIPKIGMKDIPLMHRDNIQLYISACRRIGLQSSQLFNVNDLYEKKDLESVINNIFALSQKSKYAPKYNGAVLELDGKISRIETVKLYEEQPTCKCVIM